jgi:hypothetical protein
MGLPASSDVGELARLISSLRSAVEEHLGRKISGAVPTIPYLTALYQEDLEDAFEYVGLFYIPYWPLWHGGIFPETGASYVGNGFRLCTNYTDPVSCEEEKRNPPHQQPQEHTLSISYTERILTSSYSSAGMFFGGPLADDFMLADFGLGWDKRHDNPKEGYYWEAVRDTIIKPALTARNAWGGLVDRVVVCGDCSMDDYFQKVLKQAVDDALEKKPGIFAFDPVYSAARGAAEMAKRVYWAYNHTRAVERAENDEVLLRYRWS